MIHYPDFVDNRELLIGIYSTEANEDGGVGTRHLTGEHTELVAEIEMHDDAILVDIDTPEALDALREHLRPAVADG